MNFSTLKSLNIPEGKVTKIQSGGRTLWQEKAEVIVSKFNYVSLGDSIAAGHMIDDTWAPGDQYGHNATNPSTYIYPGTYTDFMRKYLYGIYGESNVDAVSYARSGSMIEFNSNDPNKDPKKDNRSLYWVVKNDEKVKEAIRNADLITISIGGNDVLNPVEVHPELATNYLLNGTGLNELGAPVEEILKRTADDENEISYWSLLNALNELVKDTAKVLFTTQYNPMKYLHIDRGTWDAEYQDGFFAPLFSYIPVMTILGWEIDRDIKKWILTQSPLSGIIDRINGHKDAGIISLGEWVGGYLETGHTSNITGEKIPPINETIRDRVTKFQKINPNFQYSEMYELFDAVPDRDGAGEVHHNDLVNLQVTKGYSLANVVWSPLWEEQGYVSGDKYWADVISKCFDIDTTALRFSVNNEKLREMVIEPMFEIIVHPLVDVHPRIDGHYVMYRSFMDTLGWQKLNTITFNANGGTGTMSPQRVINHSIANNVSRRIYSLTNPNKFTPPTHYHFLNWKASYNSTYSNREAIYVTGDITLTAQWAINTNTLTVIQGLNDEIEYIKLYDRDYKNRKLYINGFAKALDNKHNWDAPLKDTQTYEVPYGQIIKMMVSGNVERTFPIGDLKKPNCPIKQYNGIEYVTQTVANIAEAEFYMPDRDVTIEFHFDFVAGVPYSHSYWIGYISDKDLNVTFSGRNS